MHVTPALHDAFLSKLEEYGFVPGPSGPGNLESLLAQGVSIRDLAEQVCQEAGVHAATMSVLLLDAVFPPRPTRAPKPVSADEERIRALLAQEEAALLSGD